MSLACFGPEKRWRARRHSPARLDTRGALCWLEELVDRHNMHGIIAGADVVDDIRRLRNPSAGDEPSGRLEGLEDECSNKGHEEA